MTTRSKGALAPIQHFVEEPNLSVAWARVFLSLSGRSDAEVVPLLISVTGFNNGQPIEDTALRDALDRCLDASDRQSVHTVANTIFPQSLWRRAKNNRQGLYEAYLEMLPDLVEMCPSQNRHGLYFARLIGFGVDPKTGERDPNVSIGKLPGMGNQLEFIIERCKKGTRKSMFQLSVFDPSRDHIGGAQQGFPCLQHVTLVPDFEAGTLAVNAMYATQQLFVRTYGNLLGLARLGAFVASAADLSLSKVSCFAGVEKMDQKPSQGPALDALLAAAESLVRESGTDERKAEVAG